MAAHALGGACTLILLGQAQTPPPPPPPRKQTHSSNPAFHVTAPLVHMFAFLWHLRAFWSPITCCMWHQTGRQLSLHSFACMLRCSRCAAAPTTTLLHGCLSGLRRCCSDHTVDAAPCRTLCSDHCRAASLLQAVSSGQMPALPLRLLLGAATVAAGVNTMHWREMPEPSGGSSRRLRQWLWFLGCFNCGLLLQVRTLAVARVGLACCTPQNSMHRSCLPDLYNPAGHQGQIYFSHQPATQRHDSCVVSCRGKSNRPLHAAQGSAAEDYALRTCTAAHCPLLRVLCPPAAQSQQRAMPSMRATLPPELEVSD